MSGASAALSAERSADNPALRRSIGARCRSSDRTVRGAPRGAAATCAAILAATGPAASQDGQSKVALLTALAQHECRLGEGEMAAVLAPYGFTYEFASETLTQMVLDEEAFFERGRDLRIFAGYCPPPERAPTPRDALAQAIRGAGCAASEAEVQEVGLTDDQLVPIVQDWVDSGLARVKGGELALDAALCGG